VRHLPFKITKEELFELFGAYGAIRQIRQGVSNNKKGLAYVVYEDILDAKNAVEHLNGFRVSGRFITVQYHRIPKDVQATFRARQQAAKTAKLAALQQQYQVSDKLMDTTTDDSKR
jgi:pre-mRNA branch site protein p14